MVVLMSIVIFKNNERGRAYSSVHVANHPSASCSAWCGTVPVSYIPLFSGRTVHLSPAARRIPGIDPIHQPLNALYLCFVVLQRRYSVALFVPSAAIIHVRGKQLRHSAFEMFFDRHG